MRGQLPRPFDFALDPLRRRIAVGLVQPVLLQGRAGFCRRQVGSRRSAGRDVRGDGFGNPGAELDPRSGRQDDLDPGGRVQRRLALRHQFLVTLLELFRLFPFLQIFGRLLFPLGFGQRFVLDQQFDQSPRRFDLEVGLAGGQVLQRRNTDPADESVVVLRIRDLESGQRCRRQLAVQADSFLPQIAARIGQRFRERAAGAIESRQLFLQDLGSLFQSLDSRPIQLGDLRGRQRGTIDAEIVQFALKVLPHTAAGADERWRFGIEGQRARPLQSPDFAAVQVHSHPLAVERPRAVMPGTVQDLSRVQRRVALLVAAGVQSQRQDTAAALEREQQPLRALLPEDFSKTRQVGRFGPRREGQLLNAIAPGTQIHRQRVLVGQAECVAVDAAASGQVSFGMGVQRTIFRGAASDGGRPAFVERPVREQFVAYRRFIRGHAVRDPRQGFLAVLVQGRNFLGRQRVAVDPQFVHPALETFAAVRGTDAASRRSASHDLAGPSKRADLRAVQVHPHPAAVERGRTMMPLAVQHPGRIDRRVALGVPADVQAERQNRAFHLEGEQHALRVILLAEDLVVFRHLHRHDPGGKRDPLDAGKVRLFGHAELVVPGQPQRAAEQAVGAIQSPR